MFESCEASSGLYPWTIVCNGHSVEVRFVSASFRRRQVPAVDHWELTWRCRANTVTVGEGRRTQVLARVGPADARHIVRRSPGIARLRRQ